MFGKSYPLFKLFGFQVKIDPSWLLLMILVAWSLASGIFPQYYENLTKVAYWWMGIMGALALFFSIVFHELSHSLVARLFGLPMTGITLFIFGGVAEMKEEPPSARAEFYMAIAGPASSLFLAASFYGLYLIGKVGHWSILMTGVLGYVAWLNLVLAIFNMIPAFPLDGGRVLRAFLWGRRKDLSSATNTASRIGAGFGLGMIIYGVFHVISGNFVGGIWYGLIGMFLRNASQASYQHLVTKNILEGQTVRRFMKTDPITVPRAISITDLVENYVYRHHFKMYPVVDDDQLIGCVTTREIKEIPRDEWDRQTAGAIAKNCSEGNAISPDAAAEQALSIMNRERVSRLMVVENGQLVGVVALKDLLDFLALKLELEENSHKNQ